MPANKLHNREKIALKKSPTGIKGLDEITGGGLPLGRPTLVAGGAGSGKTMFAMEFIIHGATIYDEPGVFVSFEENIEDLKKNFSSLGYDLDKLIEKKKLAIDHVFIERSQIEETGEYDLEALLIRLGYAIDSIGAKRIALDTIEVLFSGLANHAIIRAELLRLFRWLKDRGITAVVTGEKGEKSLTRYGLEEYIADCVIFLDNRVVEQLSTRRLHIIKYRGSSHGMDEYPFLIGKTGISIFPITALRTDYKVSNDHVSSGIPSLDMLLGGKGFFKGSAIMVSGAAGTGKSILAACFVNAACQRGERCIYFAMEESEDQIMRNMRSVGIDLKQWVDKGLLKFHVSRPALYGIEMHLVLMEDEIDKFQPANVVIDPFSDFSIIAGGKEVKSLISRLLDMQKSRMITVFMTELIHGDVRQEKAEIYVSSLIDTWILIRNFEQNGERNRGITVIKSRGMAHSNQISEFIITGKGIKLVDPYIGSEGVYMGSARLIQESRDREKLEMLRREIDVRKSAMHSVQAQSKASDTRLTEEIKKLERDVNQITSNRALVARARKSEEPVTGSEYSAE